MLYCHLYCNSKYSHSSSEAYLEPCQLYIYDRTFLRKYLRVRSLTVFAKNSIIYVCKGSNHTSLAVSFPCTVNKVTWRYSWFLKCVFLKILQILVENTCAAGPQACNFIKKRLQHFKMLKHFKIFKNTFFYRITLVVTF